MFNSIKPNTIVRMGDLVGVIEGQDIYQTSLYNVYNSTTQRKFKATELEILSEEYCTSKLFAYQIFYLIK